jgi:Uma2 family endonuclease
MPVLTEALAQKTQEIVVTWELLPDDYKLPDDPVDNINQPFLAASLSDSLVNNDYLTENALTCTNYGICATLKGKLVVKAPDWAYIPKITVPREQVIRSYTPHLQGDIPWIVMEFLSDTDGQEYSVKPTYPPGKWFFYEQVLQVPNYVIFEPNRGDLEVYRLNSSKKYEIQPINSDGRCFIPEMNLYLGIWDGTRENRKGYWLRWWNEQGELLLWGFESTRLETQRAEVEKQRAEAEKQRAEEQKLFAEAEKQRAEAEKQRAEAEKQRAERLIAQLRAAGIEPEI